ncbi:MAG: hypothetical protein JWO36_2985 [Myxococcales bacterium]|nr:hypothetical protein [Myxococcales bacterium]
MGAIGEQVHTKFKLFTGALDKSGNIGPLAADVAAWAKGAKAAPKSIGVEFVESSKKLILSVGYRDDEKPYGIKLTSAKVGSVGKLDAAELTKLEKAMGDAATKHKNVICHELYVTDANELFIVVMAHD